MSSPTQPTDPLTQLWNDAKAEWQKVWGEIKTDAQALETAAVADFRQIVAVGLPLAVQAIASQASQLISGNEKFGNAVASVTQQLEAKLGPVAVQDVQALVQTTFRAGQSVANDAAQAIGGTQQPAG